MSGLTGKMSDQSKTILPDATRVTVVGNDGIEYERYDLFDNGCMVLVQDEGRTVKILPLTDDATGC